MTVLCLVALRIVWRLVAGAPAYAEPLGRLTHAAARSAHIGLYALMIAMPVSGYLSSNGAGTVVPWFGLFTFPHLLPKNDALRIGAGQAHYVFAWTIAFVLAAHLGAVVWHAGIKRDFGLDANVAAISAGPADRQILTAWRSGSGHRMGRPDRPRERVRQRLPDVSCDNRGGLSVPRLANDRRQNDADANKIDNNDQGEQKLHIRVSECQACSKRLRAEIVPTVSALSFGTIRSTMRCNLL